MWYSKRRRAQNDQDFETWEQGGVCPTLNASDNTGDIRATVLIIDGRRVDDVRVTTEPIYTLEARMGTGGNNVPIIAQDLPILMRGREGKPGGGKGPLLSENMSLTLAGANDQVLFAIPIQDGREMEKKQNGLGVGGEGDLAYTLDQTGAQAVAYSIREDATADTFSATEIETARSLSAVRPSVQSHHAQTFITQAYDEYNDALGGDVHHALRAGTKQSTGVLVNDGVAATLRSGGDGGVPSSRGEHLVISPTLTAYNMDSRSPQSEEQQRIVNAVFESSMTVRRLTPIECERLMGWPDNHTLHRADGGVNSDTTRYKMCGNGVASPVAQWIAEQLLPIHEAL